MVPIDAEPQPIILAYIDLNLQVGFEYHVLWSFHESFYVPPFCLSKYYWVILDPCSSKDVDAIWTYGPNSLGWRCIEQCKSISSFNWCTIEGCTTCFFCHVMLVVWLY
jgi:hypothetical protein